MKKSDEKSVASIVELTITRDVGVFVKPSRPVSVVYKDSRMIKQLS